MSQRLVKYGLTPVTLPCISTEPMAESELTAARGRAAAADWLMLTSSRTVDVLWPTGGMPPVPVATVGSATATAASAAGGRVEIVGVGGVDLLVAELCPNVDGATVAYPHGKAAQPGAAITELEAAGAMVQADAVYDTVPIAPGVDEVEGILFASPSAVAGWCLERTLDGAVVAAIGSTTAHALARRGCHSIIEANHPDLDTIVSALASALKEGTRT